MTVHLVTFSDESMSRSVDLCVRSAESCGIDGEVWQWTPKAVAQRDSGTLRQLIESNFRGIGYWAWKPWIIADAIASCEQDGDVVVYADAGVEFVAYINYIIDRMDQDIWLFGNNYEHAHWCKRDAVQEIWPSKFWEPNLEYHSDMAVTWERFSKQVQASVIFFHVSDYSRTFVKEWLDWCLFEGGRLIDDSPSRTPSHLEFREHRHDQAILTTLAYREGIKLHYWPASYNDGAFVYEKLPEYAGDDYPILFNHHRRRNHEWEQVA